MRSCGARAIFAPDNGHRSSDADENSENGIHVTNTIISAPCLAAGEEEGKFSKTANRCFANCYKLDFGFSKKDLNRLLLLACSRLPSLLGLPKQPAVR